MLKIYSYIWNEKSGNHYAEERYQVDQSLADFILEQKNKGYRQEKCYGNCDALLRLPFEWEKSKMVFVKVI